MVAFLYAALVVLPAATWASGISLVQRTAQLRQKGLPEKGEFECMNFGGTWGVAEQEGGAELNLCANGRLLPQLYILGGPKGATTSLAYDLAHAGVMCAGGRAEFRFWSAASIDNINQSAFLEGMPPCSSSTRQVVGDFSPDNLGMVLKDHLLPPALRTVYGPEASQKIIFVVLLREPLSRLHSHWYFGTHKADKDPASSLRSTIDGFMATWSGEYGLLDPSNPLSYHVWYGSYGAQLDKWMESFSPDQFIMIPYKAYGNQGGVEVCGAISDKLSFKMDCTADVLQVNTNKHPGVDEDIPLDQRQKFEEMMAPDKELLLRLLAEGHEHGMTLPKYDGPVGSKDAIQKWLESLW